MPNGSKDEEANRVSADVVAFTDVGVLSAGPAESQDVVLQAYAHSLSLFMNNAVSNQDVGSQIANATVASTCAAILSAAK